jgi:hypothetical protein
MHPKLLPLSELRKCAKRMSKMAKGDFSVDLSYESALNNLLSDQYCDSEAEYQQKFDIQELAQLDEKGGLSPIDAVTQFFTSTLRSLLTTNGPGQSAIVEFLHVFSQRDRPISIYATDSYQRFNQIALEAILIAPNAELMKTTQDVQAALWTNEDRSLDAFWLKAAEHTLMSFHYNFGHALNKKRTTKHLLEFFAEHEVGEIVYSEQYATIVERSVSDVTWFSTP